MPLGLLVNELATNAIKHAFPGGAGHIVLSAERIDDDIELAVADDGVGMENKVAPKVPEKRGADYVSIFVRQLGGVIDISSSDVSGTTVKIRLPALTNPSDDTEPLAA